jgi:P-type Mg2+ transporter
MSAQDSIEPNQSASKNGKNDAWWSEPQEVVRESLGVSSNGLSSLEVQLRLAQFGPNILAKKTRGGPLLIFLNQFKSPIILILLLATIISAFLGDSADAIVILVIVFGSAALSFAQEHRANNAAEKLRNTVRVMATCYRNGKEQPVPVSEIVPGDVILLSAGSLIPADGLILDAHDFFVNQAVLTGETFPVEKRPGITPALVGLSERTNVAFMGTNVSSGTARVLIVKTGAGTAFGQIAERLTLRPPETEFERGIRQFGMLLSEVMLILVIAIFAFNVFFQKPVLDSLLFSIALAVGLTPQLLPAIININLSKGSQAMADEGVIVRRLTAIENFGSMDVFCTDKTGTLTVGVVKLDGALDPAGSPSDLVFLHAYLNAHFQTGLANALDQAIQADRPVDIGPYEKVDEVPYDFVRKRLSVVVQKQSERWMITKGALDNVLVACSTVADPAGTVVLDDPERKRLQECYAAWCAQGYRVLGVAVKPLPLENHSKTYEREDETRLTFEGFLLFFDPPKPGVIDTIHDLASMGVQLKVITGDNHLVALHMAKEIGIEVTGLLTGGQIAQMGEMALIQAADQANLFAEVDPNQKEHIIRALQKHNHVVGYMGDGVNDAPALHTADVGISVDTAVDVAKEAADFVLLKQDLAVLHKGILQGRRTFANTLKYVFMATSANFGNMFSVAGAALFLPFLPMLPKQILLINFLTDLPEMTIASDNVDEEFLQTPHRWDIHFIRRFMLVFGSLSSVFDYLTFGALLLVFHATPEVFRTGWFIESVVSATLVVFAVRTRLPFLKSKPSRFMLVMTALVILVTVAIPFSPLAGLMDFQAPGGLVLLTASVIVALYFVSAEGTKRLFYQNKR